MEPLSIFALLVLATIAAYIQTITGFAFGLLMMGGIGILRLLPLPNAAVLVSMLTLVDALKASFRGRRNVAWKQFALAIFQHCNCLGSGTSHSSNSPLPT